MTRIISESSASVRKSLQGLDYFAEEGARAFEYLAGVLTQSLESGASKDRVETIQEALKAGKIYLKSEFKVKKFLSIFCLFLKTNHRYA